MHQVMLVLKDKYGPLYIPAKQADAKKDAEKERDTLKGLNPDTKFIIAYDEESEPAPARAGAESTPAGTGATVGADGDSKKANKAKAGNANSAPEGAAGRAGTEYVQVG